jgi:hypothetical protein
MDWKKINSSQFEQIACSYAENIYKDYKWIPTQKTRDGNKDGEFQSKLQSLDIMYKGWYEAKYSKDPSSNIPKSHMDSTLVSGILDGKVMFILFITNARIINDFKLRATAILKPYKIKAHFVEKEELEAWLNTMPEVRDLYFSGDVSSAYTENDIRIDDACFINFSLSPAELVSPISKLSLNNEYYLYLGIKSKNQNFISIDFGNDAIMPKEKINNVWELNPGFNSILVRVMTRQPYHGTLKIGLFDNGIEIASVFLKDVLISDDEMKIVYSQQISIVQELYGFIQSKSSPNVILTISGKSGIGKSYLLKELAYSLVKEHNQCMVLRFSEKDAENACLLCELILFLNFGHLYSLSEEAFSDLVSNCVNLPFELFYELQQGVSNQIAAIVAINRLKDLVNKNIYALLPENATVQHKEISYIILDDIQKTSSFHSTILKCIFDEYCTRRYSQIMIIGKRPNEFICQDLESHLDRLYLKQWNMAGLQPCDIMETLQINFDGKLSELASIIPEIVNVFQLTVFIKKLKGTNIMKVDKEQQISIITDCYLHTIIQNDIFVKTTLENVQHKNILFTIYKIESGINTSLLSLYYGESFDSAFIELSEKSLIIEDEKEMLRPFHDTFLYAFNNMKFNQKFLDELHSFLEFCLNQKIDDALLLSKILSILILSSKKNVYRTTTERMCMEYYENSNFTVSQVLAKSLINHTTKMKYREYTYNDLLYLYIYAQSVKFSRSTRESCQYFDMIYQVGKHIFLSTTEKGIVLDALSELVNNYIWLLDTEKTEKHLSFLEEQVCLKKPKGTSHYAVNAYLNFLNRRMLYASFKNDHRFNEYYIRALEESIKFNREDYVGYANMDYAKCLYIKNHILAFEKLEIAKNIFERHAFCLRRKYECEAEMYFLRAVYYGESHDELFDIQKTLLKNRYINSYAKVSLKILTLDLLNEPSPENVKTKLQHLIIQYPDINKGHRLSLFMYQFLALACYLENDFKGLKYYTRKHITLAKRLSEDYTFIPIHNLNINKKNGGVHWVNGTEKNNDNQENTFLIDSRIW